MNIKDFYKTTKKDLELKTKDFNFKQKQIKKMIDNAKKNGEEIGFICNEILISIDNFKDGYSEFYDFDILINNINKIKNIVGGKSNE